jgi:glycosyltransferase involved in cell wall biosynthesis
MTPPLLSYDVIMATRNRPEAVELSLPLILSQTRLPAQVIIVDSSEDGTPIEAIATRAAANSAVPVHYMRAAAGLTHQRNTGLTRATADVVIFPDDDSLLYPDAAERIMEVYEADTAGIVAGVAARPVDRAPSETSGDLESYEAEKTSALRTSLMGVRQKLKDALGNANPFLSVGRRLNAQHPDPAWLADHEAVVVPYMTGFRMSFRRAAILETGFDETLRKYGWFEDIDAYCAVMRQGKVIAATRSRIYHHRVASARANGHMMGLWAILNRGYIVMKHVHANPEAFPDPAREAARLRRYCRARAIIYRALARDDFGRDRARGAAEGVRVLSRLISAPPEDLARIYTGLTGE